MKQQTARLSSRLFAMMALLIALPSAAHIKNEATQFPDIEFSDARFDIVVLVGAGIVPETPVFEPDKPLSRAELATWGALAEGLGRGGENPDTEGLAAAALDAGLVSSLDGDATLADINQLFFEGQLVLDDPAATPTKAEAASLVAGRLDTDAGTALLEKRDMAVGATGEISEVAVREGHHGTAYVMNVGGTALPMDEHGRVANGPTDLLQWEGRAIRRSFIRGDGDHARWIYLEAEPRAATTSGETATAAEGMPTEPGAQAPPPQERTLLYWLIGAALVLGLVLFISRRQAG